MNYESATSLFNEIAIGLHHPCAVHFLPDGSCKVYVDFIFPLNDKVTIQTVKDIVRRRGLTWVINSLEVMEIS